VRARHYQVLLLILSLPVCIRAAEFPCSVQEERGMLTVSGRFSVGSTVITLTMPASVAQDPLTLFAEVSGNSVAPLFLESGSQRIAVEDGGALHLQPMAGERLSFRLTDGEGVSLCIWQPGIKVWLRSGPPFGPGFRKFRFLSQYSALGNSEGAFVNVGNPVLLQVSSDLVEKSSLFRIDGQLAAVLAKSSWQVILRDPHPATGLRTVASRGFQITLPFIQVQMDLPAPSDRKDNQIKARVLGSDVVRQPRSGDLWPVAHLVLSNFSRQNIKLLCGKSYREDNPDFDESRLIVLKREANGILSGNCKIKYLREGPVNLDTGLLLFNRTRLIRPPAIPKLPPVWK
jgi:hypothetical protein